jgi:hypothetical protein
VISSLAFRIATEVNVGRMDIFGFQGEAKKKDFDEAFGVLTVGAEPRGKKQM